MNRSLKLGIVAAAVGALLIGAKLYITTLQTSPVETPETLIQDLKMILIAAGVMTLSGGVLAWMSQR